MSTRIVRRLIRLSDVMDNIETNKHRLLKGCQEVCDIFGFNKNTINIEVSGNSECNAIFGNIETEGIEITVSVNGLNNKEMTLNRVIVATEDGNINLEGTSQSLLDSFLNDKSEFQKYIQSFIDSLVENYR